MTQQQKNLETIAYMQTILFQIEAATEMGYMLKDRLQYGQKKAVNDFLKAGRLLTKRLGGDALEEVDPLIEYFVENAEVCKDFVYQSISGEYDRDKDYKLYTGGIQIVEKKGENDESK